MAARTGPVRRATRTGPRSTHRGCGVDADSRVGAATVGVPTMPKSVPGRFGRSADHMRCEHRLGQRAAGPARVGSRDVLTVAVAWPPPRGSRRASPASRLFSSQHQLGPLGAELKPRKCWRGAKLVALRIPPTFRFTGLMPCGRGRRTASALKVYPTGLPAGLRIDSRCAPARTRWAAP